MSTAQLAVACYVAASAAFGAVWAAVGLRRHRSSPVPTEPAAAPPTAAERPPSPDVAASGPQTAIDALELWYLLPAYERNR